YILNPYASGSNMILLQGFARQPVDNFYQVFSCKGPTVRVTYSVPESTVVENQFQGINSISQAPGVGLYNILNTAGTTFTCVSTVPLIPFTNSPVDVQQMFEYVPGGFPSRWLFSYRDIVWHSFNCPQTNNFIFQWSLPPNDFSFTQRNGLINVALNTSTGCGSNQSYVDLSNLYSNYAGEQGICSSRGIFNPLAVTSQLGLDTVPSYLFPTLNITTQTWMIQPRTAFTTNCPAFQLLDFTNQYGPLPLASVTPT